MQSPNALHEMIIHQKQNMIWPGKNLPEAVLLLLEIHPNYLDEVDEVGLYPSQLMALFRKKLALETLRHAYCDLHLTNLERAILDRNLKKFREELRSKNSLEIKLFAGTSLWIACNEGMFKFLQTMLHKYEFINCINDAKHGLYPLYLAVEYNHVPCVELLLIKGACLRTVVKQTPTLLLDAVSRGRHNMVKTLLNHGAARYTPKEKIEMIWICVGVSKDSLMLSLLLNELDYPPHVILRDFENKK